jgi:hypothetical protein
MAKWSDASKKRTLMKRRGSSNSRQLPQFMAPLMAPKPMTIGPTKAEQRAQAAAALEQWQKRQKESEQQ